jgi:ankyrin repeat protein
MPAEVVMEYSRMEHLVEQQNIAAALPLDSVTLSQQHKAEVTSSKNPVNSFKTETTTFKLCQNRVWAVAREKLTELMPEGKPIPRHDKHDQCTFDFCEYSQRDFTTVAQRHECESKDCAPLQGLFSRQTLEEAAKAGKSTVWSLDGKSMVEPPHPYMAISHVWSDGTGTGAWSDGQVNRCLYSFFEGIAKQFQCDGIWWDSLSIPKSNAARNMAIQNMHNSYQDARITLVHDCFLRNWEWVDAETACFAILMSPWFSRGWTALELAKSRKVKVIFGGSCGPLIKDLDEQILAKDTGRPPSTPHERSAAIIRNLRKGVVTLDDLLVVLGSRYTSWPRDRAIIAGLLVDIEVTSEDPLQDVLQQDIHETILRRFGKISPRHLFHNSATIHGGFGWCPTNLFDMPVANSYPSLQYAEGGDLTGKWKLIQVTNAIKERIVWTGTHPLIEATLQLELESPDKCVILAEYGTEAVQRALLAKGMKNVGTSDTLCYKHVGAIQFHPALRRDNIGERDGTWIEMEVRVLGDARGMMELDRKAWDVVIEFASERDDQQLHKLSSDGAKGRMTRASSRLKSSKRKADEVIEDSNLVSTTKGEGEARLLRCLQKVNPNYQDQHKWSDLHNAIWRGHHTLAQKLIGTADVDVNVQDEMGRRPLHLAAERGDKVTVLSLLGKAEVDARSKNGQTALHCAAWGGSTVVVDLLLHAGSNANIIDTDGNTAVHIAAEKGFELVVTQLLVDTGFNVDAKGQHNLTLLHFAAMNGHEAVVKVLLDRGAKVSCEDKLIGWTPLHYAAENGHEAIAKLLMKKGAELNARAGKVGWTPLHLASMKGNQGVVNLLIQQRAEHGVKDNKGWTARRFAEVKGHKAITDLLLDENINDNLDVMVIDHLTPLHCLAMTREEPVTRMLVNNHANLNLEPEYDETNVGWVPLLWAAKNGQDELVQFLLNNGADINVEVGDHTPLDWAAKYGHAGVVIQLLDKISDINFNETKKDRPAPIHRAARNGHALVVKLLLDSGVDIEAKVNELTPLHNAAYNGHEAVVELLLDRGANINASGKKDRDADTPLTMALQGGYEAVALRLINSGADWTVPASWYGCKALHFAARWGLETVVQLLLEKGEHVDIETEGTEIEGWEQWTPLHFAADEGEEGVVKLLLRYGADTTRQVWYESAEQDMTPLQIAEHNSHEAVVKVLESEIKEKVGGGNA